MARIALRRCTGASPREALFDRPQEPIHLTVWRLAPGEQATLSGAGCEGAAYVWHGSLNVGATDLATGSSLILEAGAKLDISAGADGATLVQFRTNAAPDAKQGGNVHLLPASCVPRYAPEPGAGGAAGGLHANGECPTCQVWLHENHLPGMEGDGVAAVAERGIHSHSEDEIIFITAGAMRLGARLVGRRYCARDCPRYFLQLHSRPRGALLHQFPPGPPGRLPA